MAIVVGSQIIWSPQGGDVPWFNVSKQGASLTDIPNRDHSLLTSIGANTHAALDNFVQAMTALLNPGSGSLTLNSAQQKLGNFTGMLKEVGGWLATGVPGIDFAPPSQAFFYGSDC